MCHSSFTVKQRGLTGVWVSCSYGTPQKKKKKIFRVFVPSTAALMNCTTGGSPPVLVLDIDTPWLCRYPYPLLALWIHKRMPRGGKVGVERIPTTVLLWVSESPGVPRCRPCLSPQASSIYWWEPCVPLLHPPTLKGITCLFLTLVWWLENHPCVQGSGDQHFAFCCCGCLHTLIL